MSKLPYCSFCGKSTDQVSKLIAGPSVYICNECISLCNTIIDEADDVNSIEKKDSLAGQVYSFFMNCKCSFMARPIVISDELLIYRFDVDNKRLTKAINCLKKEKKISIIPVASGINAYLFGDLTLDSGSVEGEDLTRIRVDMLVKSSTKIKLP
ncbi:hypothetical protein OO7_04294 [Providencia sneebia DSM 19967]|uniref:ClpX-type ZB domain-containing protein n=1 Tax=Providencia sneebia DSM 19967 TaxID=1141660 RepID=K8WHG6_9GAMM|nr:hypothetical protein OO7_04294 [Providencia sneebia DSM 19967]